MSKTDTINFLHEQVRALQRKDKVYRNMIKEMNKFIRQQRHLVNKLEQDKDILFDYTDCKKVEGCEEATRIINNLIE